MNLAVAKELGVLKPGDHAEDAGLVAKAHVVLKSHQVPAAGARVFLTKLHDGPGAAASARVGQAHRLHRSETECVATTAGDFFDREAGFEIFGAILFNVRGHAGGGEQSV